MPVLGMHRKSAGGRAIPMSDDAVVATDNPHYAVCVKLEDSVSAKVIRVPEIFAPSSYNIASIRNHFGFNNERLH